MTNAIRDDNRNTVLLGVSAVDGVTLVPIQADPATGAMMFDETSTFSGTVPDYAFRDDNRGTVVMGVDSTDPTKLIPLFVNPTNGKILIDN